MRACIRVAIAAILVVLCATSGEAESSSLSSRSITIVLDDNYPPFSFRDREGRLQGITKDLWDLWAQRTGIEVRLEAMDWGMALKRMTAGEADVIDTIFHSEERERFLDFSPPYATIDVPVFFDAGIAGISDVNSLKGIAIGVKEGDYCIDWLATRGVTAFRRQPSFEALVEAAAGKEVGVICIDRPAALHFIYKKGLEDRFRYSPPLYTAHLHWAVGKGNVQLRRVLEDGFALISAEERNEIEARWTGTALSPLADIPYLRYAFYAILSAAIFAAFLLAWIFHLRRQVATNMSVMDFLTHRDSLTGLPNHLLARDRLDRLISYAARAGLKVAVLSVDIDHLKAVNDSLGHLIGDALIKDVALRLHGCVRDTDTVSRQSGDEFMVLLGEVRDTAAATGIASKILEALSRPFRAGEHELSVSASIGISIFPDDGSDFDTLMRKADTAMYHSKEEGRNTYRFFAEHMNTDTLRHLTIKNGLRGALSRGEFVLHYQPQFDISNGSLIGAEALIRWNDPQRGLVPPSEFIAIAEESGLIIPMGEWVLQEACRQATAWQRTGHPQVTVAVNISAIQFTRGNLQATVAAALKESGLNPAALELELTESILLQDSENTLASVRRLGAEGVRFSIDDFGTGYSSLSYLKRFAVHKLKIDQSFVRDLRDEPENVTIVRAIIQMARGLGLHTIAEGIEDQWTLDFLKQNHCDIAQGYFLGRPVPASQFQQFMPRSLPCEDTVMPGYPVFARCGPHSDTQRGAAVDAQVVHGDM